MERGGEVGGGGGGRRGRERRAGGSEKGGGAEGGGGEGGGGGGSGLGLAARPQRSELRTRAHELASRALPGLRRPPDPAGRRSAGARPAAAPERRGRPRLRARQRDGAAGRALAARRTIIGARQRTAMLAKARAQRHPRRTGSRPTSRDWTPDAPVRPGVQQRRPAVAAGPRGAAAAPALACVRPGGFLAIQMPRNFQRALARPPARACRREAVGRAAARQAPGGAGRRARVVPRPAGAPCRGARHLGRPTICRCSRATTRCCAWTEFTALRPVDARPGSGRRRGVQGRLCGPAAQRPIPGDRTAARCFRSSGLFIVAAAAGP